MSVSSDDDGNLCMCVCNRPDSSSHGRAPETPEDEDDDESPERQRVRQRRPSLQHRYHIKTPKHNPITGVPKNPNLTCI